MRDVHAVTLTEAPAWVQDLVVSQALGFLEAEENGEIVRVESVSEHMAVIMVGGFRYTAHRREQWIT